MLGFHSPLRRQRTSKFAGDTIFSSVVFNGLIFYLPVKSLSNSELVIWLLRDTSHRSHLNTSCSSMVLLVVGSCGLVADFHFWKLDKYIKVVWLMYLHSYWIFILITKIPASGQLHSAQSSLKTHSKWVQRHWCPALEPDPKCSKAQVMTYWAEKKYMQSSTIACQGPATLICLNLMSDRIQSEF